MHIDRKPSTVMTVIDRIYHPIAQNLGVSLLLRNEIDKEIQFPPIFFISLIQITGNLVANAIKFTSSNGFVDVLFRMNAIEDQCTLKINVSDTGEIISPDLVSAFNKDKKVAKLIEKDMKKYFGSRLEYVMQLISEVDGRIFVESREDSGTTFSLTLPLQDNYLNRKIEFQPVVKNDAVQLNGS